MEGVLREKGTIKVFKILESGRGFLRHYVTNELLRLKKGH